MVTNLMPTDRENWLTNERKNWLGAVIVALCAGYGVGNGHTTQGAIEHVSEQVGQKDAKLKALQTKIIPALQDQAGCEHSRADKAAEVGDMPDYCRHVVVPKK